jgi:hypothetical protein
VDASEDVGAPSRCAGREGVDVSDKDLKQLNGGVLCLAHASLVTGDTEECERMEGDLPPYLDDDELMCGPFADVFYRLVPLDTGDTE